MHPGLEYPKTPNSTKEWTQGEHSRNFIKVSGAKYIDADGKPQTGEIGFWGEWEAHATIERDAADHRIFSPYLDLNKLPTGDAHCGEGKCGSSNSYMDTDPFVFGKRFCYANCKQPSSPALRNLEEGSLILFSTIKDGRHLLDTVFVVGDKIPAWPSKLEGEIREKMGSDFDTYSKVSLSLSRNGSPDRVLYQGATFENFEKMFSFVPASLGAEWTEKFVLDNSLLEGVFTVQEIAPSKIFENGQTQGFATITEDGPSVQRLWKNIRDKVLKTEIRTRHYPAHAQN